MPDERVVTIELFFDLVFVFTITQLTTFLVHHPTGKGIAQVVLLFGNLWWMYGGYAWLTNAVPPRKKSQQLLVLLGMAGFLVIALATPGAFGSSGAAFGAGYLVVTLVHTGLFLRSSDGSVVKAITRLGPFNLLTAALVVAGGLWDGAPRWALWSVAFVLHWLTPYIFSPSGIGLRPAHFVERHGAILLIAIGESVVAVGIGLHTSNLTATLVFTAILALAIAAALWWLFFEDDDERSERALREAPAAKRAWMALHAFGDAFLLIVPGVVVFAAGVRLAAVHPGQAGTAASVWFLSGGVAAYCAGLGVLRAILGTGRILAPLVLTAVVLVTAALGAVSSLAQLSALAVVLVAGTHFASRHAQRHRPSQLAS